MAIRLIGLDLDGTLFNSRKELTAHTCAVLAKAVRRGIHVVPATGRPRVGLPQQLLTIPGIQYAVVTNGAAVCDLRGGKRLFTDCMDSDDAAEILRRTRPLEVVQGAFSGDWGYMEDIDRRRIRRLDLVREMQDYLIASRKVVDDLAVFARGQKEGIEKIVINFIKDETGAPMWREETENVVRDYPSVTFMSGGIGNIEIIRRGVGKGTALLRLGERLGVAAEEIMAVGDSENDLDMIRKAGLGVAMANSERAVLDCADYVTASNDEDGAAAAIERFALGENGL
ncbi:MAG TPA: Cof-type HAD-IIB family hydrolase [Firmicutes bacterium]|nr:Cof-type HAD-IIB family hydrolase [Bacillota bacterium]